MRARAWIVLGVGAAMGALGVGACTVDGGGTGAGPDSSAPDANVGAMDAGTESSPMDVTIDVTADVVVDAAMKDVLAETAPADVQQMPDVQEEPQPTCTEQSCGGACCGGRCMSRNCGGCDAGSIFCSFHAGLPGSNGYCVADCSSCNAGGTSAGVTCFSCVGAAPAGRCALSASECPASLDAGACSCPSGDAGDCPGSTQVCAAASTCLTCGQPTTDLQVCASRKQCNQQNARCP
jgi:hypothetical protein